MSVFTSMLMLATILVSSTHAAPNKKAEAEKPQSNNFLRPRQGTPYSAEETSLINSAPPAITGSSPNGPATGLAPLSRSTGTGNLGFVATFLPTGFLTATAPLAIFSGIFPATGTGGGTYGSGSSSGFVPYATRGVPYQNATALYVLPSSLTSLAAPAAIVPSSSIVAENNIPEGSGTGNNGQSAIGAQCPPPQTVTLPAHTITLPASTVTVTANTAPQTITQTITVVPQVQTQTITITVTVTAGLAPACPSVHRGTGNSPSQRLPVATTSKFSSITASNAQAGIVPPANAGSGTAGLGTQGIGNQGGGTPGISQPTGGIISGSGQPAAPVLPMTTVDNNMVASNAVLPGMGSGQPAVPILPAATSTSNNSLAIPSARPAAISTNNIRGSVPSAIPAAPIVTSITPNQGQNSVVSQTTPGSPPANIPSVQPAPLTTNGPVLIPSGNLPISPAGSASSGEQAVSGPPFPPSAAPFPFQNSTGPSNATGPSGIGSIVGLPGIGPTGSGFAGPTSGPTAPIQSSQPSPQNVPSIQVPPFQVNTSSSQPVPGSTSLITTQPASLSPIQPLSANTTSSANNSLNLPFTSLPPISTVAAAPPAEISAQSAPPLSPTNTDSTCSINDTSSQNITANYDDLKPFTSPLLYLGLNYTSFTLSSYPNSSSPSTNHLTSLPTSFPKSISISPPFLSFALKSVSLSCGDGLSPNSICNIEIAGLGPPSSTAIKVNGGKSTTASLRAVRIVGMGTQRFEFDGTWGGLAKVSFSAQSLGMEMGVGVDDLEYEIFSAC